MSLQRLFDAPRLSSVTLGAGAAAAAAAGLLFFWLCRRRDESIAKAVSGGTLVTHPASYHYLLQHIGESGAERAFREVVQGAPRAQMMGSPDEAAYLRWLLEVMQARRVLEVGVFRGSTTLQLARGVGAGGEVVALDVSAAWLETGGRAAWAAAGVESRIRFIEGPATESLRALIEGGAAGSFDFAFIDADKPNYREYYEACLQLLRKGGVVAVDNVLWHGKAEHPPAGDVESQVIHDLNNFIRADARVSAVMTGLADGVYFARKL